MRRGRGGGQSGRHLAGDGLQHVRAGEPALQLLPVSGHHRQAVAAVVDQLAHGLGQGLVGEQDLRGTLVGDGPGQRPPRPRPGRRAAQVARGQPRSGNWKGRMASAAVSSSKGSADGAWSMSMPRRSSLVV